MTLSPVLTSSRGHFKHDLLDNPEQAYLEQSCLQVSTPSSALIITHYSIRSQSVPFSSSP